MAASLSIAAPLSGSAASEPTREMVERAVHWHQRLCGSGAKTPDVQACRAWCAEHPSHALAYARIEALWSRFDRLELDASLAALDAVSGSGRQRRNRQLAKKNVLAAAVLAVSAIAMQYMDGGLSSIADLMADHRTATGEQRTIALEDGSRVALNTNSAVDIEYSSGERRVHLRKGEVLVQVGKESRPFVVATPQGIARALGTRYLVRRAEDTTEVTVLESLVRVCADTQTARDRSAPCVDLHPGQRADIHAGTVSGVKPVDVVAAESWRDGALLVDDRSLAEVLAELARYRPGLVLFDTEKLKHLRVSGTFPLKNTDNALQVIAETQPVRIGYFTPWVVSVEPR